MAVSEAGICREIVLKSWTPYQVTKECSTKLLVPLRSLRTTLRTEGMDADRRQVLRGSPVGTGLSESLTKAHLEANAGEFPHLLFHTPGFLVVGLQGQPITPRASLGWALFQKLM